MLASVSILCFFWPNVGPGIISEILQYIMEAGRSSSSIKEEMFGGGSKTKLHGLSGCTPDQTGKFGHQKVKVRKRQALFAEPMMLC